MVVQGDVGVGSWRGRGRLYGPEVKQELKKIWQMLDYLCGKNDWLRLLAQDKKKLSLKGEIAGQAGDLIAKPNPGEDLC